MALVVTKAATLPSTPKLNALNWSAAATRAGRDPTTKDLWDFRSDGSATAVSLYTSQDNGQTWVLKATDATTPYTGALTGIMSVCQDVTNGAIHFAMYDTSGVTNARGYGRATFTTSSGHITGYTWAATPFVLTTHTASSVDPRGQIIPVTRAGSEYLLYHIGLGNSTTVTTYYTGLSTSLTPSSSASFVGIDNSGSDTQTVNLTDAGTFGANHSLISVMVQDPTTEDLYLVFGFQFTGDLLNNTGSASSNLWFKQLARSGSYWTAPTSTTAGTTIVGDNGSIVPTLMNVYPAPGLGAYVMAGTPASGVQFYKLTGGTATAVPGTPNATTNKGGLGAFSVDASGRIYCAFVTMILNDASPTSAEAYFDGSKWTSFADTGADCIGFGGTVPWAYGVAVIQERGSSVAQTNTGAFAASIFNSSPIITVQPQGAAGAVGGTATFTVTAVATVGSLSYQWKLNGANVGTNSASYTTGTLASGDNGGTVTVDVTDTQGTTTSIPARLWVKDLPSATKGINFPGWAYSRIQRGLPSALHLARKQFGSGLYTTQASQIAFNDWYFGTASTSITITSATTDGADVSANTTTISATATSATTDGADVSAASVTVGTVISASSATTDGADVSAASATVNTNASSATTDGADVSAASATVNTNASSATTDGADVSAASATVNTNASSATTDGADVSAASATVNTNASSATTDGADVSAASATVNTNASSATTDGADVSAASATVNTNASSATTDGADTSAAAVSVGNAITATSATTDGADVSAASASINTNASSATTDGADVSANTTTVNANATSATTDGADVSAASVTVSWIATLATTDGADTSVASVGLSATATIAKTDGADVSAAAVSVTGGASLVATIAVTDGADICRAFLGFIVPPPAYQIPLQGDFLDPNAWFSPVAATLGVAPLAAAVGKGDNPDPNAWAPSAATLGVGSVAAPIGKGDNPDPNTWAPGAATLGVGALPGGADPYSANVSLLLHNDTSGFIDSSLYAHTVTNYGGANVTLDTSIFKFGTGSARFQYGVSTLVVNNAPEFDLSTGDWTIECFAYFDSAHLGSGVCPIISKREVSVAGSPAFDIRVNASGQLTAVGIAALGGNAYSFNGGSVPLNTWFYVELDRHGSVFTLRLNGVTVGSGSYAGTLAINTEPVQVGGSRSEGNNFGGYIDEVRITKGVARYTADFTPPTAPFADPTPGSAIPGKGDIVTPFAWVSVASPAPLDFLQTESSIFITTEASDLIQV